MRQPTLDEAARLIDAGDAMAEKLRGVMHETVRRDDDDLWRLIEAWRDATREVAP